MKQLNHNETPITPRTFPIVVMCDGIVLPANIGAIFRLADAFGVEKVIFGGEDIDTSRRKVKQVSRSTHQWVKYKQTSDLPKAISELIAENYHIIGLEITNQSKPIDELNFSADQKTGLIIGGESHGISQEVLNLCDQTIHIPIYGRNSSMNVVNALAIFLHEITKILNT